MHGHDASEDFSLEWQRRAGRVSAPKQGDGESIARTSNKPSSAEGTEVAFPDRIRPKYYVMATDSQKDESDREARRYADEWNTYLALLSNALCRTMRLRQKIMTFAKERIAQHLGKGIRFCERQSLYPVRDRHEQSVRAKDGPLQSRRGARVAV